MRDSSATRFVCLVALVATVALGCGDDAGGDGGGGAATTATAVTSSTGGAGGQGGAAGAGGEAEGGGGAGPAESMTWTFDGAARATSEASPPTASLEKSASFLTLTIHGVDAVASATLDLSLTIPAGAADTAIPAGSYACAPPNQPPAASISAAEGALAATSSFAGHQCTLVLDASVTDGGVVRGSLQGSVSDASVTYPVEAAFDLSEPPG